MQSLIVIFRFNTDSYRPQNRIHRPQKTSNILVGASLLSNFPKEIGLFVKQQVSFLGLAKVSTNLIASRQFKYWVSPPPLLHLHRKPLALDRHENDFSNVRSSSKTMRRRSMSACLLHRSLLSSALDPLCDFTLQFSPEFGLCFEPSL